MVNAVLYVLKNGSLERTLAWLSANRRLSKKYDRLLTPANAWIMWANIRRILLKQLPGHTIMEVLGRAWAVFGRRNTGISR